jgi:flagellar assembly protein FliH
MSLSNFYKKNQDFQPDNLVGKTDPDCELPVWGESIIKENIPLNEDHPETPIDPHIESEFVSEPEQEQESVQEEATEEIISEDIPEEPVESAPPPPVSEPELDIDALRQESFIEGVDAGRQQAEEDFENGAQTLLCICNELDSLRETILKNSAQEMKELVMNISEKIIRHSVSQQEDTIVATIKDAIQLAVKSDEFQIQINPKDLESLDQQKQEIMDTVNGLDNIVFQANSSIERGGCRLESTCCTVDASLSSQIDIIRDSVMDDDNS